MSYILCVHSKYGLEYGFIRVDKVGIIENGFSTPNIHYNSRSYV